MLVLGILVVYYFLERTVGGATGNNIIPHPLSLDLGNKTECRFQSMSYSVHLSWLEVEPPSPSFVSELPLLGKVCIMPLLSVMASSQ
jgi:hypothetical protein